MIEAHSLDSIRSTIDKKLPYSRKVKIKEPVFEPVRMDYMVGGPRREKYRIVEHFENVESGLIGILFCHPGAKLTKEEVLEHLPYFHVRSGESIDFFCVGYGAYWPEHHFSDQRPVAKVDGVDWFFSNESYAGLLNEFEKETDWEYSGEVELILINATKNKKGEINMGYETAIVCNLEKMSADKAFTSVRAFFEDIFRQAKKKSSTTWSISDNRGLLVAKNTLKNSILSLLPKNLQGAYSKAEHYAVRNIGKSA